MAGNSNSGRKPGKGLSKRVQDELRAKIDSAKIINSLISHIEGKDKMESTQVTAATALLRKVLPDLQATELSQDPDNPINPAVSDKPLDDKQFDKQYHLGTAEGASKSIN